MHELRKKFLRGFVEEGENRELGRGTPRRELFQPRGTAGAQGSEITAC